MPSTPVVVCGFTRHLPRPITLLTMVRSVSPPGLFHANIPLRRLLGVWTRTPKNRGDTGDRSVPFPGRSCLWLSPMSTHVSLLPLCRSLGNALVRDRFPSRHFYKESSHGSTKNIDLKQQPSSNIAQKNVISSCVKSPRKDTAQHLATISHKIAFANWPRVLVAPRRPGGPL